MTTILSYDDKLQVHVIDSPHLMFIIYKVHDTLCPWIPSIWMWNLFLVERKEPFNKNKWKKPLYFLCQDGQRCKKCAQIRSKLKILMFKFKKQNPDILYEGCKTFKLLFFLKTVFKLKEQLNLHVFCAQN